MATPLLFQPMQLRSVTLKNRIVVAPMHQYSAVSGYATDWHLMNAGRFAAGGAGCVMMESTKVARNGCGTVGDTALWNDDFIAPLKRCSDFIRAHGSVPAIQLGHSGRKARLTRPWEGGKPLTGKEPEIYDWEGWELVAPSAVPHTPSSPTPRAFTNAEVKEMIDKWGDAAARADKAGFDLLEIHAAHGYLLHQFLSPVSNVRNDEYGGTLENRMRFPTEVAACVRKNWPEDKPLFMRFSCEDDAGWTLDDSVELAKASRPQASTYRLLVGRHAGAFADGWRALEKIRLPGSLCRAHPQGVRHHDHGRRPYRPRRSGRGDLAKRAGRPRRDRPGDALQPELADGRRPQTRRRRRFQERAAAAELLAVEARKVGLRGQLVDLRAQSRPGRRQGDAGAQAGVA